MPHGSLEMKLVVERNLEKALNLGMGLKTSIFKLVENRGIQSVVDKLKSLEKQFGEFYQPDEYLLNLK